MKTLKRILLSLGLIFALCQGYSINTMAEEGMEGVFTYDYYYDEYGGYTHITGYHGDTYEVVIPDMIGGHKVESVYESAFSDECSFKTVTVSANVDFVSIKYSSLADGAKIILLGDNTRLSLYNYEEGKKIYVECNCASVSRYWSDVEYIFRDANDISKAKITVEPSVITKSQAESGVTPSFTVEFEGKKLVEGIDYYLEDLYPLATDIGEVKKYIAGTLNEKTKINGIIYVSYTIIPDISEKVQGDITTTHNKAGIKWEKSKGVTGYEIYRKEADKYKLVNRVKGASNTSYIDTGLKESTAYTYKIRAYKSKEGKKFYSEYSDEITIYTLPKKAKTSGYKLTNKRINVKAILSSVTAYDGYNSNWTSPSEVNDFIDYKGRYTMAYASNSYVYIQRYNSNLKHLKTLKIKKKYPQLGDVICDKSGNYYIAWGKNDVKGKGNVVTFAISKYNYKGKHIKTATLKSYDDYDGKEIFEAGNCAMAISGNHLVCSYAKQMYNGHQKNETFAVNIKNMKKVTGYNYWVSHSFNQRVIALRDGGVLFGDHGDANVTRGFALNYNNIKTNEYNTFLPFHFWGLNTDDMFHINKTYAQLGNIGEVDTGYVLVATSAKSMTSSAPVQKQQLMVQIISHNTGESVLKGSSRSGSCLGIKQKDTGIKWLTNYKDGSYATNSNMIVIDRDRIVVMWERHKDYEFVDSYYMILASNGKILKKATSLKKQRLCGNEELNYHKGYIYWTSAEVISNYTWETGYTEKSKVIIHKLKVSAMK
ncbi:MAG: fibronectin type III domain-containing protein [Lachnospiraceae bacterium]|nr:fibronectin type III domain-containing protein [Lachnospiraceae bacterium]